MENGSNVIYNLLLICPKCETKWNSNWSGNVSSANCILQKGGEYVYQHKLQNKKGI